MGRSLWSDRQPDFVKRCILQEQSSSLLVSLLLSPFPFPPRRPPRRPPVSARHLRDITGIERGRRPLQVGSGVARHRSRVHKCSHVCAERSEVKGASARRQRRVSLNSSFVSTATYPLTETSCMWQRRGGKGWTTATVEVRTVISCAFLQD